MKDTEGNVTDIAYDGLDAVSETDQSGKSSSAAVYDKYGNLIQSSKELAASASLLKDGSFEGTKLGWNLTATRDSGSIASVKARSGALSGQKHWRSPHNPLQPEQSTAMRPQRRKCSLSRIRRIHSAARSKRI